MYGMYGIEKDEEKPSPYEMWSNTIDPNDKPAVEENLFNAKETNGEYNATFKITTSKGETRYIHALGRNELDSNGNALRMVGTNTDITTIKINEKKIVQQKEEFETIFKSVRDGIAIINFETKFVSFNDAFIELIGYSKEELLTKTCRELTVEEDREKNDNAIKYAIEHKYIENIEKRCITKDGKVFTVNMSISLLPDKQKLLLTIKDMTSIKLLQEQAKLASMGEMIGNIAHQWRQPLSIISTGATGLKLQKEYNTLSDEQFNQTCDAINDNAQYLSKTIDDFRDFIKGERKLTKFKLVDTIESFLHLVEGTIKDNDITIVKNIQEDIIINSYPNELTQCFINIFNNAKDALKEIKDDRYYFISAKIENNEVIIAFKDNAGGIPEDILTKVFEPYFTTKHQAQGTGLGLSMTYNLITSGMNGTIEAENINYEYKGNKYIGAELLIKLPLQND
jgi:two-component system, LuxR family, sensor kinase FixL